MVYFMNTPPEVKYKGEPVTEEKIVAWMNEWSEKGSSITSFKLTREKDESDIRVVFTDEGKYSGNPWIKDMLGPAIFVLYREVVLPLGAIMY